MRLWGTKYNLDDLDAPVFIGRRQTEFNIQVKALIDFNPIREYEEAGIAVYIDHNQHYKIGIKKHGKERIIFIQKKLGELNVITAQKKISRGLIILYITADAYKYSFSFKLINGKQYIKLGSASTRFISQEVAQSWTGVYIGMYASGNGKKSSVPADFDWFSYKEI